MRTKTWWSDLRRSLLVAIAALAVPLLGPAQRAEAWKLIETDWVTARLDTTLTYGLAWRVQDRDSSQIGAANGGTGANPNWDDGNLNYGKGLVSNQARVTSELDVSTAHFGAFLRGTAFYDYENMKQDRARTDLGDDAIKQVGKDIELLDAYLWGSAGLGPFATQLRVGDQVVNWGESTFILGGIGLNTLNPINVGKLRSPGAELREALVPEGMVYGSVGLTEGLSVEGLYVYDWEETKFDESGTYFSILDFAVDDGFKLIAANIADNGTAPQSQTFLSLPRSSDLGADDQGQFGAALRYFAPWLHDTELSFYYMRYHSKTPVLSVRTGTAQGAADMAQVYTDAGVAPGADPATDAVALDAYLKTNRYRAEYAEDIDLFGIGFNTEALGWGFQGEVSHRKDVPLQIEDTELLFAMLGSVNPALAANNQVGDFGGQFEKWINGGIERDMTQVQMTFSKLFGATLGADGSVFLAEVAWLHVHDMPSKSDLRLETYGPFGTGNAVLGPAMGVPIEGSDDFPDADSGAYVLYGQLDYNNALGPVSLSPRLAWSHDVIGTSPNGGPFLEGRKAFTAGLGARYLEWTADLSYTNFLGAGKLNQINDRDFVGINIKYRF